MCEQVTDGGASARLHGIYTSFLSQQVEFTRNPKANTGLPQFGMSTFAGSNPFFVSWLRFAEKLIEDVKGEMLKAVIDAGQKALAQTAVEQAKHIDLAEMDSLLTALVSCSDAKVTLRRLVHSHRFDTSLQKDRESTEQLMQFVNEVRQHLPHRVLGMVIELCVWEPIEDLRRKFQTAQLSPVYQIMSSALDATNLRKEREHRLSRVDAYKRLLGKRLGCPVLNPFVKAPSNKANRVPPAQEEEEDREDQSELQD
eukprot:TRINITY_DN20887_c0_g3_i1.p1 TRINITY_DN20887_c0_g3~~TRINITY_DN20887_c0_g3_i1.p1  ORF type:complete len:284 (-),score=43.09 TRINITY_DN20887_c0_g3_i1:346-1110(-)